MSAHTSPKTAPKATVSTTPTKPAPVPESSSEKISPTNRPSQAPDTTPPMATRCRVSRPVTRSSCLRSVPTMRTFCTGNSWSDR